jgi:hypothetical protein
MKVGEIQHLAIGTAAKIAAKLKNIKEAPPHPGAA